MSKTYIIAEAGVNHNGNIFLAKKLIDIAKNAGADAVKFQTFITKELLTKDAKKALYQKTKESTQFEMIKKLELSFEDFIELKKYCDNKGIEFLSTPFDLQSARFLNELGMKIFKIPSGEITNYLLLREIAKFKKPIILSTGMSNIDEIKEALNVLIRFGAKKEQITILHCNSEYPTPFNDVNLKAMLTIKEKFGTKIGYSDHTLGIEVSIAAVAMGASVIEKHFTISNELTGPDHKASLTPFELKKMVKAIRNIEISLGDGIKRVSLSEAKNKIVARKFIVAKKDIKKGEIFSEENLTIKRTGIEGISPMRWEEIVGKKANKDYKIDEIINF